MVRDDLVDAVAVSPWGHEARSKAFHRPGDRNFGSLLAQPPCVVVSFLQWLGDNVVLD